MIRNPSLAPQKQVLPYVFPFFHPSLSLPYYRSFTIINAHLQCCFASSSSSYSKTARPCPGAGENMLCQNHTSSSSRTNQVTPPKLEKTPVLDLHKDPLMTHPEDSEEMVRRNASLEDRGEERPHCMMLNSSKHKTPRRTETDDFGHEKLKKNRTEMAGPSCIPELWGKESLLKDWIDSSALGKLLAPMGLALTRDAMVEEHQRARSKRLRVRNQP